VSEVSANSPREIAVGIFSLMTHIVNIQQSTYIPMNQFCQEKFQAFFRTLSFKLQKCTPDIFDEDRTRKSPVISVFPDVKKLVPWPYIGLCIGAMDSYGGWIASAIDLMGFVTVVDGLSNRPDILKPETIEKMVTRPEPLLWEGSKYYYGMGWYVTPMRNDANWWHRSLIPGSSVSFIIRSYNDIAWVALFNSQPKDREGFNKDLDKSLWRAINEVTEWPAPDLFHQPVGYTKK